MPLAAPLPTLIVDLAGCGASGNATPTLQQIDPASAYSDAPIAVQSARRVVPPAGPGRHLLRLGRRRDASFQVSLDPAAADHRAAIGRGDQSDLERRRRRSTPCCPPACSPALTRSRCATPAGTRSRRRRPSPHWGRTSIRPTSSFSNQRRAPTFAPGETVRRRRPDRRRRRPGARRAVVEQSAIAVSVGAGRRRSDDPLRPRRGRRVPVRDHRPTPDPTWWIRSTSASTPRTR